MRLCVDCACFIQRDSKCGARLLPDPVRGMKLVPYAAVERAMVDKESCGPEAKHFKPILVAA